MYDLWVYLRTKKILKPKSFYIKIDVQAVDTADSIGVKDTIENSACEKSLKVLYFSNHDLNLSSAAVGYKLPNLKLRT